jgi:hypothetical protein
MVGAFQGSMAVMVIIDSEVAEFLTRVYEALDGMGLTSSAAGAAGSGDSNIPVTATATPMDASSQSSVVVRATVTASSASTGAAAASNPETAAEAAQETGEGGPQGSEKKSLKDAAVEVLRLYYYSCDVLRRKKNDPDFNVSRSFAVRCDRLSC